MESNRRDFIKGGAALTAAAAAVETRAANNTLPTVKLGKHEVTRLVAGSNPIYGFSHFNRLFSQHMRDYHTPERVVEFLKSLEASGINTWQASFQERAGPDLTRFREQGGKLHWICLCRPDFLTNPAVLKDAAGYKPIAIVQHGQITERLWQAGEFSKSREFLKRVRETGVMVGLSAHNPVVLDRVESEGWDVDFFMTSFYYINRPKEEWKKLLAEVPLGEVYLPSDPSRMCAAIRQSKKPCLAYKILAAGRMSDTAEQRKGCFEFAFRNIKPGDAVIVGMYNRFTEQVRENADLLRTLLASLPESAASF